ncbi:MAG: thiamine-phosphate kinase [Acidimicrobiales bacterium]
MASPKIPIAPGGGQAAGEDASINRIRKTLETRNGAAPEGQIWLGDDAAVVSAPGGGLVLTTDAVVDGVHVDLDLVTLSDLGWKALTAAVSDIGAMGGRPLWALSTVGFPPEMGSEDLEELFTGIAEACERFNCRVVGGDLTVAPRLFASICIVGTLAALGHDADPRHDGDLGSDGDLGGEGGPGQIRAVTRSGARPGDQLFVTGPLGGSAAGLRVLRAAASNPPRSGRALAATESTLADLYRRPAARVEEGWAARVGSQGPRALVRSTGVSAMIDVSDGLSIDLFRLAEASSVGVRLFDVPVREGASEVEALGGGEDYELVVATSDPEALVEVFADADLRTPIHIGECTDDPLERSLRGESLVRQGWEHPIASER